jgi:hypothetical protein
MFRFTIRDVLWLTVLAAVCCAWWLDRRELKHAVGHLGIGAGKAHLIQQRLNLDDEGMNEFIEALDKKPTGSVSVSVHGKKLKSKPTPAGCG